MKAAATEEHKPSGRSAPPRLTVAPVMVLFSPRLDAKLCAIVTEYRRASRHHLEDLGTAERLGRALAHEQRLLGETLEKIKAVLVQEQSPAIDCELLESLGRLRETVVAMQEARSS
ncbi:MAG TPA: hypothetical protein VF614_18340 [Chthoniobacteraceae bacterium]